MKKINGGGSDVVPMVLEAVTTGFIFNGGRVTQLRLLHASFMLKGSSSCGGLSLKSDENSLTQPARTGLYVHICSILSLAVFAKKDVVRESKEDTKPFL